ncbi:uncharacterized protein ACNLHF_010537 isoform 2-T2 [Anomaloglossus baeobatrachus]
MAAAVTYADLRFAELPLQEMDPSDDLEENDAECGDVMYENITGANPTKIRPEPSAPPTGSVDQPRTDIDLRHQLDNLSASHLEQSRSLTQRLQRKEKDLEAAEDSLERGRLEKEALASGIKDLNKSFLEYQKTARNSTETVEQRLKEVMSQKEEQEKEFCPENWTLFGKKCFYFSKEKKGWDSSWKDCEERQSHMAVLQEDDAELKSFLMKEEGDFWVGKELKGSYSNQYWKWPENYKIYSNNRDKCWKISKGEITANDCWSWNKWICEKNLLLTSMRTETPHKKKYYYFSLSLWEMEYKCEKLY